MRLGTMPKEILFTGRRHVQRYAVFRDSAYLCLAPLRENEQKDLEAAR